MDSINKNTVILIKKASGEEEAFSVEKLKKSLLNAGADDKTAENIVAQIAQWIEHGTTTKKIYRKAFSLLHREKTASSIRYRLKQAILELGPTGYPFEHFVGELFRREGFKTEVGVVIQGNCVSHEMDVVATNSHLQHLVECKYHKEQGKQVSVQVPLYVRSRVNDIIRKRELNPRYKGHQFTGWVITNTRFSNDSINYGKCSGLKLLAWDYPTGHGLKERIEKHRIYPITILKNLSLKEKQQLMSRDIVTCSQLYSAPESLEEICRNTRKQKAVLKELNAICNISE